MMLEITEVTITEEKITISGVNLESLIMVDDLFEDVDEETVSFEFDRSRKPAMTYLYKVVKGQKKCQSAKNMGDKLIALAGVITTLSDSFRVKE